MRLICLVLILCSCIIAKAQVDFSVQSQEGCVPYYVQFFNSSSISGSNGFYYWDFGDGSYSTIENPIKIYPNSGTYDVKLVVNATNGQFTDSLTKTNFITVYELPTANFQFLSQLSGCKPLEVSLKDTSVPSGTPIVSWLWDFGNGMSSTNQNPIATYTNSINTFITLYVTDQIGCEGDTTIPVNVHVSETPPTSNFSLDSVFGCKPPHPVTFTNLSSFNGPISYLWHFGDGDSSFLPSPMHIYNSYDTFTAELSITDTFECISTFSKDIVVRGLNADFRYDTLDYCKPTKISFYDSSSIYATDWRWSFGNGDSAFFKNITYNYIEEDSHIVSLEVRDIYGCIAKKLDTLDIIQSPKAFFDTATVNSCIAPFQVSFQELSLNANSYQWNFGDMNTSNIQNPTHTYSYPGSYNVSLSITDTFGCSHTFTHNEKVVIEYIQVSFEIDSTPYCSPAYIFIDKTLPNPKKWYWNFGDGDTSNLNTPTHTYLDTGTYNVFLKATGQYCSDSTNLLLHVDAPPSIYANFYIDSNKTCNPPFELQFRDSSLNAASWVWNFGDGGSSLDQHPKYTYTSGGTFDVSLSIFDSAGCSDQFEIKDLVKVDTAFKTFSYYQSCESPFEIVFYDPNIEADTWYWDFGDGQNSSSKSPTHTYITEGWFSVTATISNSISGCSYEFKDSILIKDINLAIQVLDNQICKFETAQFINNSTGADSFIWKLGDGTVDTTFELSHNYNGPGFYSIQLFAQNELCRDTLTEQNFIEVLGPTSDFSFSLDCKNPLTVAFSNNSILGQTYYWDFGDGNFSNTQHPTHDYPLQGNFEVSLITNNFSTGCQDTMKKNIHIDPLITDFAATTHVCYGDSVTFIDFSDYAESWLWSFGDGNTSDKQNPVHFYAKPDTYTVSLIITANQVCHDTLEKIQYIKLKAPKSDFEFNSDCDTIERIFFKSTSLGTDKWLWDFGDGTTDSVANPKHYYSNPGIYITSLYTENIQNGCNNTYYDTVIIKEVIADFYTDDTSFCFGNGIQFYDSSSFAFSYLWDFGDGRSDTQKNPINFYDSLGTYDIKLTVTDPNGCMDSIFKSNYLELLGPKSIFKDSFDCVDFYTAHLIDFSEYTDARLWHFGDGLFNYDTLNNIMSHTYTSLKAYNVSLQTMNFSTGCSHIEEKTVILNIPNADFRFSDSVICEFSNVSFNDLSTYPRAWEWDLTNTYVDNGQNPNYIYTHQGTYDIELKYTDINGCKDTFLHPTNIIVYPIPSVDFNSDTIIGCEGLIVNFIDNTVSDTSLITWLWSFTDYETSTLQNPVFQFDTARNYNIQLEVVNARGCESDTIKSAYISITRPSSSFNAGTGNFCFGDTVPFSQTNFGLNQSLNSTYSWDLGDSTFTNDIAPFHYYPNYGIYPVTFIVTDSNTCADTSNRNIYIQQVDARLTSLSPTYKNCPPLFVNFSDSSVSYINYWEWDFGDNTSKSYLQNPIHNYIYADTFDVQLIVRSSGNCWDTLFMEDYIIVDGPYAEVNYGPTIGCKPLGVTFNIFNQQNVNNFFYDFADGTNFGTGDTTIHYYDQVGTFYPSLWISDSLGCNYFFPSYDSIFIEPVKADFDIGMPVEGCRPLFTSFSDLSLNATSWQWYFGDGDIDSVQNTSHNFDSSGDFNITLIIEDSVTGCTDTLIRENAIDVYDLYANISADTLQGCSPFSIKFTDNSTTQSFITKWGWDFGTGIIDSTPIPPNILFSNNLDTNYSVRLWVEDNEGCQDSTYINVDLDIFPKVAFISDTNIACPGSRIFFLNQTLADSGSSYLWTFKDSITSDSINPSYQYWENGYYDITLYVMTPAGCDSTLKIDSFIHILSRPKITISGGQALTINETAQLLAGGGISYSWTPQDGLNDPYIPNPIADPDDTTVYVVSVIDTNNCENKDSLTLIVTIPEEPLALIPDAFSPNGDGQNDLLTIIEYDIQTLSYFKVYNRWGQLLFETNSLSNGWDGTFKGEPQDMGTYIYLIVGYSEKGEKIVKKGDITLIR